MENNKNELVEHQDTELRLGLPGSQGSTNSGIKRYFQDSTSDVECVTNDTPSPPKAQVMGWPPIRSYRKNAMKKEEGGKYVKVSMDGAPYLRKIDMKLYQSYPQLLKALEDMFQLQLGKYSEKEGYNGEEVVATYEDKDGDWMLVGDVPWEMFINSCKRLRIMKGSEARGLASCLP